MLGFEVEGEKKKLLEADEMRDGLVTAAMGWSAGVSLVWVADGGGGDVVDGVTLFSTLLVSLSLSLSLSTFSISCFKVVSFLFFLN